MEMLNNEKLIGKQTSCIKSLIVIVFKMFTKLYLETILIISSQTIKPWVNLGLGTSFQIFVNQIKSYPFVLSLNYTTIQKEKPKQSL